MQSSNFTSEVLSRRKFLAGATTLAMSTTLFSSCKPGEEIAGKAKIGLQLYTVRNQIAKDLAGTLTRVSEVGFHGVETGFWPEGISIEDAGKALRAAGLNVFSAHCEIPVGDKKADMLRMADAYGCKRMVWHGWPEDARYKTRDGVKALANLYNEAFTFAKENGLQFGIHNHWWEFHNKIDDKFAYEVLLEDLDKAVFFELDTYWLKTAGHDPAKIIKDFGKRAPLLHIKDGPARYNDDLANDKTPMTPAGKGTQDFPAIVKAAGGNTEWMIVEMDQTAIDVFDAIQQSYDYLVDNNLADGQKPVIR